MGITPPRQQEIVHHYTETAGIVFTRQSPASVLHLEVFPSREKPEESGPPYTHRYEQPRTRGRGRNRPRRREPMMPRPRPMRLLPAPLVDLLTPVARPGLAARGPGHATPCNGPRRTGGKLNNTVEWGLSADVQQASESANKN